MSDTKHTPGPWQVSHIRSVVGTIIWRNDGNEDNTGHARICRNVTNPADAEFIVRACNSHDQLVAALQAAREALNNTGRGDVLGAFQKVNEALAATGAA